MAVQGWKRLVAGWPWFQGAGQYPIPAYSEFMPPPRLGRKVYDGLDQLLFDEADPWGWRVTEYEEALELQPGMKDLAGHLLKTLRHLGRREPAHGIARGKLRGNPYWPEELQEAGAPEHERYVMLLPLALSRTQDDKGRVRWTLFGTSEQGPQRAFWRSFFSAPSQELPEERGLDFIRRLLVEAYGERPNALGDLRRAGFRIFAPATADSFVVPPSGGRPARHPLKRALQNDRLKAALQNDPLKRVLQNWHEERLPKWSEVFRWKQGQTLRGVRYLLTFCPFSLLPPAVRRAYRSGNLHLLPFPGSLAPFGALPYLRLQRELPLAMQIPLLHALERHEAPWGIRVPQSGWLHEAPPGQQPHPDYGPHRNTYRRTHRWARVHRHEDELAVLASEDKLAHVLFSSNPDDVGLYDKPMARNAQIWTDDFRLLLDGPRAAPDELAAAHARLRSGGLFGYRMQYPAMRVGRHEVYWHRPLVAYLTAAGEPELLADAPLGYLTAYSTERPRLDRPLELWPRLLARPAHQAAVRLFMPEHEHHHHQTLTNVRKLLQTWELCGRRPLERGFARQLLTLPKEQSLEEWLASLPERAADRAAATELVEQLRACLGDDSVVGWDKRSAAPPEAPTERHRTVNGGASLRSTHPTGPSHPAPPSLTFAATARRSFEMDYWKTIARLAQGRFRTKDNADCVNDPATQSRQACRDRDLDQLADYLLAYHEQAVSAAGMSGRALVGELPFHWQTDFPFDWSDAWLKNQQRRLQERDLVVVIPGRDHRRAIIMADHYDTAYMEDEYGYGHGGGGPRLAAAGADDNHSATAALMLAAPIFLRLAKEGRLACDIWLVHLTGEEFPADCMGARHLCRQLVEGTLRMRRLDGRWRSLASTRVEGVYVLDMVAHNNEHDRDVFQICPGASRQSLWLAEQAHAAGAVWNASTATWNERPDRKGRTRGRRSADARRIPPTALHLPLYGEIRPVYNPRSTLFNTDGQIFSDAGVPVVLFMENYDINRHGYHDTQDTMANIDLDYGSAVAAIAIETVARAATEEPA